MPTITDHTATAPPAPSATTAEERRAVASYRRRAPEPLPAILATNWRWQQHARCRGMNPAIFFPTPDRGRALLRRETSAKTICRTCPVLTQCRSHALTVGERYGVWGGLSTAERALLATRTGIAAQE